MSDALYTLLFTGISKFVPVLLSFLGIYNDSQISSYLQISASLQIFLFSIGLGQTASLNSDFLRDHLFRTIILSLTSLFIVFYFLQHSLESIVLAWACSLVQLAYQFFDNRLKIYSLYTWSKVPSALMLIFALILPYAVSNQTYARIFAQYLPLAVFVIIFARYFYIKNNEFEFHITAKKSGGFNSMLFFYALCSSGSFVAERHYFLESSIEARSYYFYTLNAVMIFTFLQDYVVKNHRFTIVEYKSYATLLFGLSVLVLFVQFFSNGDLLVQSIAIFLIYTSINVLFSLHLKLRSNAITLYLGFFLLIYSSMLFILTYFDLRLYVFSKYIFSLVSFTVSFGLIWFCFLSSSDKKIKAAA
jgi:hypothetical protein